MPEPGESSILERAVQRHGAEKIFRGLTEDQRQALSYLWAAQARPAQLAPRGSWFWWCFMGGRGAGKTRAGAEAVRERAKRGPGELIGLAGPTPEHVVGVMIDGPAGIMACSPRWEQPEVKPAKKEWQLRWPNGARGFIRTGADPASNRGPQHTYLWCDELPHWKRAQQSFDNLAFGLRLGDDPRGIVTTTPFPSSVMRRLLKNRRTVVTRGSTYSNRRNLAPQFIEEVTEQFGGSRLGRQELFGELLDDVPGALWTHAMLERLGFRAEPKDLADYWQIVVAIDPSASDTETSDECGIVTIGSWFDSAERRRFDVLEDRSGRGNVSERYGRAIDAFLEWEADRFVVEVNAGGDHIAAVLRAEWQQRQLPGLPPIEEVRAQRGHNKRMRAEPIAALYEQERVRHCDPAIGVTSTILGPDGTPLAGRYDELEDELTSWSPLVLKEEHRRKSPGRMDALVWGLTYLSSAKRTILV